MAIDLAHAIAMMSLAIDTYADKGHAALSDWQRKTLAFVFVDLAMDPRFRDGDPADPALRASLATAMRDLLADPTHQFVLDHRASIWTSAKAIRGSDPEGSLILYATYIEHWLNSMIIVAARGRGLSKAQCEDLAKSTSIQRKLDWAFALLGIPPLDDTRRGQLMEATNERNAYVHYKWTGRTSAEHAEAGVRLIRILGNMDSLLEYLAEFQGLHHLGPASAATRRLFNVDVSTERRPRLADA